MKFNFKVKSHNKWIQLLLKMPSLFLGFILFSIATLETVYSNLGVAPWDVLHMGIVYNTHLTLGEISQIVGLIIIFISCFLGIVPGIGSIFNMYFIGIFIDFIDKLGIIRTPNSIPERFFMLLFAIVLTGFGSFFYLRVELGAGPRDGLMEGLVKKLNKPIWVIRGFIEISVLIIGYFLGGPVGVGTLVMAFLVGFSVDTAFKIGKYDSKTTNHMDLIKMYKFFTTNKNLT
ncbi:membrane protein [Clostridium sp. JS66]|uniref:YczE/YyaS/YitT family protein n=1 Tax=Clostridium sp. JS66 TaxID=3064705 RepID=UPI00298D7940|nr:membrane protein [Clostridium sp. JS66]WPC44599.1 membrane protein [Clostridium sp. JS66]